PLLLFYQSPIEFRLDLCKFSDCYFSNDAKVPQLLHENRSLCAKDIKVRCFAELSQSQDPRLIYSLESLQKPLLYYWPYYENHTGIMNVRDTKDENKWNTIRIPIRNEMLEILWIVIPQRKIITHDGSTFYVPLDP